MKWNNSPLLGHSSRRSSRASIKSSRRGAMLEHLEDRCVPAYLFLYNPGLHVADVIGDAATRSLTIRAVGGLLEHDVDGGGFDSNWGGFTVPASISETVNIELSSGEGSSLKLGTNTEAASLLHAAFKTFVSPNTTDTLLINDSSGAVPATGPNAYTVKLGTTFRMSGPGIDYHEVSGRFSGGVTLAGATVTGNEYSVESTFTGEPVTVSTPSGFTSTVDIGDASHTLSAIEGLLTVKGDAAISIDDASDISHSTATFDDLGSDPSAKYRLTGLSPAAIQYGSGVTSVTLDGGTNDADGVIYAVNGTQSGTTTTINGGSLKNQYRLSNNTLGTGLDRLLGAVVLNAGKSDTDTITLDDSGADFNDNYTITSSTVTRTGLFAGLTYNGTYSTLALFAENTLGGNKGNNLITIDSTANNVATTVNGQGGVDTITVNGTGTGGSLKLITGSTDGSTVNVVANSQQVDIDSGGLTTVNIGSTGGSGTMAGIQSGISVLNVPNLTTLNFHDEDESASRTWVLDNNDTTVAGSVARSGASTVTYNSDDLNALNIHAGKGGNTFTVNNTSVNYPTTLSTGTAGDIVNVFSTGNNTLTIHGQSGEDVVTLGNSTTSVFGMQGLAGTIDVDNALGTTSLNLNDSQDAAGRNVLLSNDGTNGQVTGISPATINYVNAGLSALSLLGGTQADIFTVNGTLLNASVPNTPTNIQKGFSGGNSVTVQSSAVGSVLNLTGGSLNDSVTIDQGSKGVVNVDEVPGSTSLILNLVNDGLSHNFNLTNDGKRSTLHDTLGNVGDVTYLDLTLSSFTINTDGSQIQVLNVDFRDGGNPIPLAGAHPTITPFIPGNLVTLFYNSGDSTNGALHTLNILGTLTSGPFKSEIHNANEPILAPLTGQHGSIFFLDTADNSTGLQYTGLQPISDTASATNYAFHDLASDQSFLATDGPVIGGFQTLRFRNIPAVPPPTFETTDIANKTNVLFDTPSQGTGVTSEVDITTASAGLASLVFHTSTNQDNQVTVLNTPAGVATSVYGSFDEDITRVRARGVAPGTTLVLVGGGGVDTLQIDAGVLIPTVTPGLNPGELLISVPGFGVIDASGYSHVELLNLTAPTITAGSATGFKTVRGQNVVDAPLGTFTMALPNIGTPPAGLPASDFSASVDWSDPSPALGAGTITRDAGSPSVYHITGTHNFTRFGTFGVGSTIRFSGATYSTTVNGVPIAVTLPPSLPTAGSITTVLSTASVINVTAFPIFGIEGNPISNAPVATFVDMGAVDAPSSNYSAEIFVVSASGSTIIDVPAASIQQAGNSSLYYVIAPTFSLPDAGTYRFYVAVRDVTFVGGGGIPMFIGTNTATSVDAPLSIAPSQPNISTSEAPLFPVPVFGAPEFVGSVASFTDGNPNAVIGDFTATIDWGDGTSPTVGIISQPGAVGTAFVVSGSHTYADAGTGSYSVRVQIQDADGARLTVTNIATVSNRAITLVGSLNPTSDSGRFNDDGITNVTQPNFTGTSEPHSHVRLFANGTLVGQTEAGSDGSWSITSSQLADGTYAITATAIDQFSNHSTAAPVSITPELVIDTVAPRITFASFDRFGGRSSYLFQDFLPNGTPGGSGLLEASVVDANNYYLNRVHSPRVAGRYIVTSLTTSPGTTPASVGVDVIFNNGHYNPPNWFRVMAFSASHSLRNGLQDLAGNALDGEFYGQQTATGNGVAGGDFGANVKSFQKTPIGPGYSGPLTLIGYPHPGDLTTQARPVMVFHKTPTKPLPRTVKTPVKPAAPQHPKAKPIVVLH